MQKGRGAQINPKHRFIKNEYVHEHIEGLDVDGLGEYRETRHIGIFPKKLINRVLSPDVSDYSMNPYQGCEHGCVYCYARNTHEYWGYGSGKDFESIILVKRNAPQLLWNELNKRSWKPSPIMLSGNTDCYQPAERQYRITRQLLQVMLNFRNPAMIITKNSLILRDLDVLKEMAALNLVSVAISITTLQESVRRKLEPRTATIDNRFKVVEGLAAIGIPVTVLMGPVVPGLTGHEVMDIAKRASEAGATGFGHILLRLNGSIGEVFINWVQQAFPDRADKIISLIKQTHRGKLNASEFGTRMRGEGQVAQQITDMVKMAQRRYFGNYSPQPLSTEHFRRVPGTGQLTLGL